jgi:precorrin-3B synthase
MNAPFVRNACPTLSRPMQTGDGLLARLNPVAAGIVPQAMIGLAEAALSHGNGIMEVTQRGSLQIRGLTPQSAASLAAEVDDLGIEVRAGIPVETGPLAGLDPEEIADPAPLAEAIRAAITKAGLEARLGPKVSVVVDGGGRFGLERVLADIRLDAVLSDGKRRWRLALAGDAASARSLGLVEDPKSCVIEILAAIASLGRKGRAKDWLHGEDWRSTLPPSVLPDISPTGREISSCDLGDKPISPRVGEMSGRTEGGAVPQTSQPFPITQLNDSHHALPICLPFGSIHAADLIHFLRSADSLSEIRVAPQRRLLLFFPSQAAAEAARQHATEAGFITSPADPRARIIACPGAPACGSGEIPTREIARELARHAGWMPRLHISGCAKRCAAPRHHGLTLLGEAGAVALMLDGDAPAFLARTSKNAAASGMAHVLKYLAAERRPAESDAALLRRVDPHALATAFASERNC